MIDYPNTYIEKYMSKELPLEEVYAECSSELLKFRLIENRNLPYIEHLEFQAKYLESIIVTQFMKSKNYKLKEGAEVKWVKEQL